MAQIIAIFNTAGGVAKSTLTHNLGYHLAYLRNKKGRKKQKKVLLIDLDTNATLTNFVGLTDQDIQQTVYHSIVLGEPLPTYERDYFDVVPTTIDLSGAEIELATESDRNLRLKKAIAMVEKDYDYILIDCPASFGVLSNNALAAANGILIPVKTQHKSFTALEKLFKVIGLAKKSVNPHLKMLGFVPTMFHVAASQDKRTYQAMIDQLSGFAPVFSPIKEATAIADASEQSLPLAEYNKRHPMIKVFDEIAKKVNQNK